MNDTPGDYYRRKAELAKEILAEIERHKAHCPGQKGCLRWWCDVCVELDKRLEAARYVGD